MFKTKYLLLVLLFSAILTPLGIGLTMLFFALWGAETWYLPFIVAYIVAFFIWLGLLSVIKIPQDERLRYLPVVLPFAYYMLMWVMSYGLAGYDMHHVLFDSAIFKGVMSPQIPLLLSLEKSYKITLFPFLQILIYAPMLLVIHSMTGKIKNSIPYNGKRQIMSGLILISGISIYQYWDNNVLAESTTTEKVEEQWYHFYYHPSQDLNSLSSLDEEPTLVIDSDHPILDGAIAAFPVYVSAAEMIYRKREHGPHYRVLCSNTPEGYKKLIEGEVDLFFGVYPSEGQIAAARERGKEFSLIPIAKEAFVFFVNCENPIDNLSIEQIQNIYLKKTKNWKDLGGHPQKIIPFQRPVHSGSQTAMLGMVMKDKILPPPLKEEFATSMNGIIERVAAYRNYTSAIGYSFRFYATSMKQNDRIKLIAINGIEPTIENIQTERYPFTTNLYAVTTGNESENTKKLIDWFLSPQGQRLVEKCGYVPLE